jgi:hypothetical protein
MFSFSTAILCVVVSLIFLAYKALRIGRRSHQLPKGPPTVPILGNLHLVPKERVHLQLTKWAQQYGGMYSLKIGSGNMIVLTDRRLIKALVDKKAAYNSRAPNYVGDLVTKSNHALLIPSSVLQRNYRKVMHQHLMESQCEQHHVQLQNAEAAQLLRDLVVDPDNFTMHAYRYSNSTVMSIGMCYFNFLRKTPLDLCLVLVTNTLTLRLVYGIRTPTIETPHLKRVIHILELWIGVMGHGAHPPIDLLPVLKWIPERFWGNWKSKAAECGKQMNTFYSELLENVVKRRETVGSKGSVADGILDQQTKLGFTWPQQYFAAGTLVEAGSETTATVVMIFLQAMIKYPELQKKAQMYIDEIVGQGRSPQWSDYSNLPYITQIIKEVFRWRPVAPLAFPHLLTEGELNAWVSTSHSYILTCNIDDWVEGKLLPKGSSIVINVWGLHHDPERYPNHDVFDPENFAGFTENAAKLAIAADVEDRDHYGYGAGRRFCPGANLAERNIWLAVAKILWAFDLECGTDENGNVVQPDVDPVTGYVEGLVVLPKDFKVKFTPRNNERKENIFREFENAQMEVFSQYESPK